MRLLLVCRWISSINVVHSMSMIVVLVCVLLFSRDEPLPAVEINPNRDIKIRSLKSRYYSRHTAETRPAGVPPPSTPSGSYILQTYSIINLYLHPDWCHHNHNTGRKWLIASNNSSLVTSHNLPLLGLDLTQIWLESFCDLALIWLDRLHDLTWKIGSCFVWLKILRNEMIYMAVRFLWLCGSAIDYNRDYNLALIHWSYPLTLSWLIRLTSPGKDKIR